jgi:16S rRNA (cytosine967-C5)-methyltransferase
MTSNYVDIPRETALKILFEINEKNAYSNLAINKHLNILKPGYIDKVFITGLVYGTIKWKLTIDRIIEEFSNIPTKKVSPWILNILRLGVYQLLYTDRIPDSAACNESVKLAAKYGHRGSKGYVNGILRNIARKDIIDTKVIPEKNIDILGHLSIKYSHPKWLVKRWIELFGKDFTEDLIKSNNENPDFSIRVNTVKISKEDFIKKIDSKKVEYLKGRYVDNALIINNPAILMNLGLHEKGYFQIQDEASMLASLILNPLPGELVIDACAAPGGKTSHIAELMKNKGVVIARDIYRHKIKLISENSKRLGLDIVKTELYDACKLDEKYIGKIDRVLVDVPCTGLGIIRRKPDIKWSKSIEDIDNIKNLQQNILRTSAKYLKPGGVLVYSTCTIEPGENFEIIKEFLESNNEFIMSGFDENLLSKSTLRKICGTNKNIKYRNAREGYIQFYPNIDGVDGLFIGKLQRRK